MSMNQRRIEEAQINMIESALRTQQLKEDRQRVKLRHAELQLEQLRMQIGTTAVTLGPLTINVAPGADVAAINSSVQEVLAGLLKQ